MYVSGKIQTDGELSGRLSGGNDLSGGLSIAAPVVPAYDGPYEFVATSEAQVIHTDGLQMHGDLIIDPIPSNYGLITWNGSTLTVS